jgi:cysteine-rich repeat protein
VRVTDEQGATDTAGITVSVDNTRPTALITSPAPSERWSVGQPITFAGSGTDPEEGILPASALHWQIVMLHCPGFDCHVHLVQELTGVTGGQLVAPDHEYPSFLEIVLTVIDSGGLTHTTSVQLQPDTASLSFDTVPSGLGLTVGPSAGVTPFSRDVIVGSQTSVAALSPQTAAGTAYTFESWSDGGPEVHNVLAPAGGASWVAHFSGGVCGNGMRDQGEACDDGNGIDDDCCTNACELPLPGGSCSPTTTTTLDGTTTTTTTTVETSTTTTSTTAEPTPTTTTTVAALEGTTTTTVREATPATTSSTLPIRCAGDAQCDDGDPCTVDRCAADGCTATPLAGLEGARCAVDRVSSGLCRPDDLSKAFSGLLRKRVRRARKAILAAETAGSERRAKLLRIAERRLTVLTSRAVKAEKRKRHRLAAACADRVERAVGAAQGAIRSATSDP